MTQPRLLFRQEAIDFQRIQRQWGEVASLQPLSLKVTSWLLVGFVAVLISFLAVAQYGRKETAVGYLTPAKGTAKIFVSRRGTVREVHVHEGQEIREGNPLLTIDTDQIAADGSDVNQALLETLTAQQQQLARNIREEEQRTESERDRLIALTKGLQTELSQLRHQLELQNERLQLLESEVAAGTQLREKGYIAAPEARKRQLAHIEQKHAISSIMQLITAKQGQLTEANFGLQQLPTLMAQKVQNLRNELAAASQRAAEIKGRSAYVMRAPINGRVTTLQAKLGHHADPQRLQLEIIPHDTVLHAELLVPARAIGFVEAGQPIRVLYDAFPYQHFGTYKGRVTEVSQTILTSSDAGGPIRLNEPAYRVIASIERQDIDAHGKRVALQPDMLLKADIILERRTLISWLTHPLRSVRM